MDKLFYYIVYDIVISFDNRYSSKFGYKIIPFLINILLRLKLLFKNMMVSWIFQTKFFIYFWGTLYIYSPRLLQREGLDIQSVRFVQSLRFIDDMEKRYKNKSSKSVIFIFANFENILNNILYRNTRPDWFWRRQP